MKQLQLGYPLARNSDVSTSHMAERKLRRSGEHARQKAWVLSLLRAHPGYTARELAEQTEDFAVNHPIIWRRLPDLEKEGFVIKGPINHRRRPAVTWFPTDRAWQRQLSER
jgi:DNA-binding MarR family transcriptional regulator